MATLRSVSVIVGGGGDYTSLSAAESGEQGDISLATGSDEYVEIHCSQGGGSADTTGTTFAGWTTQGPDNYVAVINDDDHGGAWNTSAYRLEITYGHGIDADAMQHFRLIGLQIAGLYSNLYAKDSVRVGDVASGTVYVERCIIRSDGGANTYSNAGVKVYRWMTPANCDIYLRNNIFYDWANTGRGISLLQGSSIRVWNNTVHGCAVGYAFSNVSATIEASNNLAYGCDTDWSGSLDTGSYNASEDGTHLGTSGLTLTSDPFVNAASKNFHLAASTQPINAGTDLSSNGFSNDIDDDTRSGTWDIGADEYVSVGGANPKGPLSNPLAGPFGGPI